MVERTALQAEIAARFLADGVRLPLRVDERNPRVLRDADGEPRFLAIPTKSLPADSDLVAMLAMLANIAAGIPEPDVTDRADPHHLAAVKAESRQQAGRMDRGFRRDAAE